MPDLTDRQRFIICAIVDRRTTFKVPKEARDAIEALLDRCNELGDGLRCYANPNAYDEAGVFFTRNGHGDYGDLARRYLGITDPEKARFDWDTGKEPEPAVDEERE
jgi:hypothetical protein